MNIKQTMVGSMVVAMLAVASQANAGLLGGGGGLSGTLGGGLGGMAQMGGLSGHGGFAGQGAFEAGADRVKGIASKATAEASGTASGSINKAANASDKAASTAAADKPAVKPTSVPASTAKPTAAPTSTATAPASTPKRSTLDLNGSTDQSAALGSHRASGASEGDLTVQHSRSENSVAASGNSEFSASKE